MINATDRVLSVTSAESVRTALIIGIAAANGNGPAMRKLADARATCAAWRAEWGFDPKWSKILTDPADNLKLDKSSVPSYGITLQHFAFKSVKGRRFNFCPNAGHCTKVCVLDNGNGRYNKVQRARSWKSDMLLHTPTDFFVMLGWDLQRAVRKHGKILCRPNVNSDLQWERIAPALVDGSLFGNAVTFYGYTKLTDYLSGDGWITPHYRVAYSLNERSDWFAVARFLDNGGSVAVVTDRKPKSPIVDRHPHAPWPVLDADVSDEWILESGVIGDLSAKGKARSLIGKSDFVKIIYSYVPVKVGR